MNSGQQQGGGTLHDSGIGWAILLIIFAILIWVFWYFFHVEIRNMVRWIRYGEMWLVSWFLASDYTFTSFANTTRELPWFDYFYGFEHSRGTYPGVDEIPKQKLNYTFLSRFSVMAMEPLKMPFVILLGLGAVWCMFLGPGTQHRRKISIESLIDVQSEVFPVISPFIKFNPSKQPPRPPGAPVPAELPLFAEALGPEEWLAYNSINVIDGKIDEASATSAFIAQLGTPWRGVKRLDGYKKVLLAAFCLRASRKRDACDDMLGRLARCWSVKGGMNLSKDKKLLKEANKILSDKDLASATLSQCNRHGFEATAMLRALQFAREEGGVLAPATFVWLRAHDRVLWYPLNNLGRQSFHMEALGAMSHFKAEKLTRRPIPIPKVSGAVETIVEYMGSIRARPIPQLDYSQSKKRGVKKAV